jgi:hypothetical protein
MIQSHKASVRRELSSSTAVDLPNLVNSSRILKVPQRPLKLGYVALDVSSSHIFKSIVWYISLWIAQQHVVFNPRARAITTAAQLGNVLGTTQENAENNKYATE